MVMAADPASNLNTHHFTLTDGTTTLGLMLCDARGKPDRLAIDEQANPVTAMKVANGGGGYDDYTQPYSPIAQVDWAGGLGMEYADQDMTRYMDGNCCDTSSGKIMPAGMKQAMSGYSQTITQAGTTNKSITTTQQIAGSITPSTGFVLRKIRFVLDVTAPDNSIVCTLLSDSSGPSSALATATTYATPEAGTNVTIEFDISYVLVGGTKYWIRLGCSKADWNFHTGARTGDALQLYYSGSWHADDANTALACTLLSSGPGAVLFFELNGALHAINRADDGATPTMWRNGVIAKINSTTTNKYEMNTAFNLGLNDWAGKIVKLISGPGAGESQNWRTIVSNTAGANSVVTVSPPWNTPHTTDTVYMVYGTSWAACSIGTFPPTKPITDVCVVDDRCYLLQGDQANICRIGMSIAAGGPTYTGTDEGAKADLMEMFTDSDGKKRIFMTVNATSLVYKCEVAVAMSTRTQVNNNLAVGSSEFWITGLQVYDDPQRPFVFKEDSFGSISQDVYGPIPIGNVMRAVRSRQNGIASCTNDRFLFFSMGEKLMRYYPGELANIGPDQNYGLPAERRGAIVDLAPYPGGVLYAAVDAGDSGYSSIIKYNGAGWCEIYRAAVGVRIRKLFIQNMPGTGYQRLMFSEEEDISWIPISSNPIQATGYTYAATATLTTGYFRTAYKDVKKFWNALALFIINNSATRTVLVEYRTETATAWTTLGTYNAAAPSQEVEFNATTTVASDITGLRIQLRFTLTTPSPYTTAPYIEQMLIEAVTRVPTKKAWHVTARIFDLSHDLRGKMSSLTAAQIKAILEGWANSDVYAKRLLAQSADYDVFTNKRVFIEPGSFRPLKTDATGGSGTLAASRKVGLLARLTLIEA